MEKLFNSLSIEGGQCSLTLNRLRVFENRVLRQIFRPKRDEMIRRWRS
jgi:hypothetical protein